MFNNQIPCGPNNMYSFFKGKNPPTTFNKNNKYPTINSSSFIGPFSSVIGDVRFGKKVFVASNVSIRADEGTPFYIGNRSNIQDNCIIHGLANQTVRANGSEYSVFIGDEVSVAHGSIVHGPCKISKNTFVGFNSVVFNCIVGEGCYIDVGSVIAGGVSIPPFRYVPIGSVIDTQKKANQLEVVDQAREEFAQEVIKVNNEFAESYSTYYSCGGDNKYCDCDD